MAVVYDPKEPDFHKKWRPAIAWTYVAVCLFDFIIAPIGFAVLNSIESTAHIQWAPLTLTGGGLYHMSMLAILGVTSYGRSQEKINATGERSMSAQFGETPIENNEKRGRGR